MKGGSTKYANVVATIALFFALAGGAAYAAGQLGKNAVKSKNIAPKAVQSSDIAPNAVKGKQLAANAVSGSEIKSGGISRSDLKDGTLAGLHVLDVSNSAVPGLTTNPTTGSTGTAVPLTGTVTFTPQAGKSYVLLTSLKGNPVDADGVNVSAYSGLSCDAAVSVLVNGHPVSGVNMYANANSTPPYNYYPIDGAATSIGMQDAGVPQTITANAYGDSGCGQGTAASLRIAVVELG